MALLQNVESLLRDSRFDEALAMLEAAGGGTAHPLAYGVVQRARGRLDLAAAAFQQVLRNRPDDPTAHTYLGMVRLMQGRMAEGWAAYRARWSVPGWPSRMLYPAEHLWDGRLCPGLRLLLWCEQGYGDALQFARFVPWLAAQGIAVTLQCPAPLRRLFAANWPSLPLLDEADGQIHAFDAHLPVMDLPAVWRGPLPGLPMGVPYLRAPPPEGPVNPGRRRIGVAWTGRPTHPDQHWRCVAPEVFERVLSLEGVDWLGLQPDETRLPRGLAGNLPTGVDFWDTARLVAGLDLVLTVDTAVAHLAGAMGKPVWVLLPFAPDWRWGLHGGATPWYPTLRLFRQAKPGDWPSVLDDVAARLTRTFAVR